VVEGREVEDIGEVVEFEVVEGRRGEGVAWLD
jgi:hypothetical protein